MPLDPPIRRHTPFFVFLRCLDVYLTKKTLKDAPRAAVPRPRQVEGDCDVRIKGAAFCDGDRTACGPTQAQSPVNYRPSITIFFPKQQCEPLGPAAASCFYRGYADAQNEVERGIPGHSGRMSTAIYNTASYIVVWRSHTLSKWVCLRV